MVCRAVWPAYASARTGAGGGPVHRGPRRANDPDGPRPQLPAAVDRLLVDQGYKGKRGAPAFGTMLHRIAVLSKTHQLAHQVNPCGDALVRELLAKTRRAYAKRGALPHKQRARSKEPFQAALATCDDTLRGRRDRALLLFAWATGGRRRSEVAAATLENLRRVEPAAFLYVLAHSKTNQAGVERPQDTKPLVGSAGAAMRAWLAASGITSGALLRRIRKGGSGRGAQCGRRARHRQGAVCACGCRGRVFSPLIEIRVRDRGRPPEHAAGRNDGNDRPSERRERGGIFPG